MNKGTPMPDPQIPTEAEEKAAWALYGDLYVSNATEGRRAANIALYAAYEPMRAQIIRELANHPIPWPTHEWAGDSEGHNCSECEPSSVWKCDRTAHSIGMTLAYERLLAAVRADQEETR